MEIKLLNFRRTAIDEVESSLTGWIYQIRRKSCEFYFVSTCFNLCDIIVA